MPGRIVLYGATGYMGGLTARAMVVSGARPVLAGRDRGRLDAVAARLSQSSGGPELETAVAGTETPGPLRKLLDAGDVLVSTAGPFVKIGRAAVAAAVDAGAVYLDSIGEPSFIRQVFEEFAPRGTDRDGAVDRVQVPLRAGQTAVPTPDRRTRRTRCREPERGDSCRRSVVAGQHEHRNLPRGPGLELAEVRSPRD
jgi:hypothetical protein